MKARRGGPAQEGRRGEAIAWGVRTLAPAAAPAIPRNRRRPIEASFIRSLLNRIIISHIDGWTGCGGRIGRDQFCRSARWQDPARPTPAITAPEPPMAHGKYGSRDAVGYSQNECAT